MGHYLSEIYPDGTPEQQRARAEAAERKAEDPRAAEIFDDLFAEYGASSMKNERRWRHAKYLAALERRIAELEG